MATLHVEISGRVQGVGFRWFVRKLAGELKLKGWVRNLPSGDVEVAAAGDENALVTFRERLTKGPPGAFVQRVTNVSAIDESALNEHFSIAG